MVSVALELTAEPNLKTNLAANSSLPRGAGLAAKFPGDAGLKAEPQVIFADNFEAGGLGEGWDEVGNKGGKVLSLVNSAPTFTEHHLVTNGCSELLAQVFGDKGAHARSAFGVAQLPFGSCVEIELIAELA